MYSIQDLIDNHQIVWFSVGSNEEIRSQFLGELMELGISWVSGDPVTENDVGSYFMGIGPSYKVGYISWQIWRATWLGEEMDPDRFYNGGQIPVRVDYERYSRGETEYLVKENIVRNVSGYTYPIGGRALHIE